MFIFFLTVARYVEMVARHRSTQRQRLAEPAAAGDRASADGRRARRARERRRRGAAARRRSPAGARRRGRAGGRRDRRTAAPARRIHADRESLPVERGAGDRVTAGTINLGRARWKCGSRPPGRDACSSRIVALLDRAQAERPRIARGGRRHREPLPGMRAGRRRAGLRVLVHRRSGARLRGHAGGAGGRLPLRIFARDAGGGGERECGAGAARRAGHPAPMPSRGWPGSTRVVFDKTGTLTDGRSSASPRARPWTPRRA